MSEMLGNQYYLSRQYNSAYQEFSEVLQGNTANLSVKKKQIICSAKLGFISKSLNLFSELLKENIEFVVNSNPEIDDCPCIEIITDFENQLFGNNKKQLLLSLGILWAFCDINKSIYYFRRALELFPSHQFTRNVLVTLLEYKVNSQSSNK